MAYMVPDKINESAPFWERRMFDRFRNELSDDVIVLHSLGIARHINKRWGECDFVLITPEGIFYIEIKGGGVQCHKGKWTFTSPNGKSYTKHESPWEQAKNAMFSIQKDLESARPELKNMLYGFGVVIPEEVFQHTGPELEQDYLLDRREWHYNLSRYIERLVSVWEQRFIDQRTRKPARLTRRQREDIRKALRPDSYSVYTLSSRLNLAESQLVDLTSSQIRAFEGLQDNRHVLVTGGAGTGKTLLAVEQAKRFSREGFNVLFLCYSRLLAAHINSSVSCLNQTDGNISVYPLYSFFRNIIIEAGYKEQLNKLKGNVDDDTLYESVFPNIFQESVLKLEPDPYDVLIIDEAQDILGFENLQAIDLVLKKGLRHGRWQIFLDKMQNIFNSERIDKALEHLEEMGFARYRLSLNCRNTLEVAVATSVISGLDMALTGAISGGYQNSVYYEDGQFRQVIGNLLVKLQDEGFNSNDIIFLSTRQLEKSSFAGIKTIKGKRIVDLSKEHNARGYDFCTMHSFKGLERKIVIAADMFNQEIPEDTRNLLLYSGLSRAMTGLILMVNKKHRVQYEEAMRAFGARLASIQL